MNVESIIMMIKDSYDLEISSIDKIKNVYKICSDSKYYCLKTIKYEFGHFIFIINAMKHLQNNGFEKIPEIISTKSGAEYTEAGGCFYYLTQWIEAREANYDNPLDIAGAIKKLGELHKKSENFNISTEMNPRVGWFKWIDTYNTRRDEILDFKRRIEEKSEKTRFDEMYLDIMEEELDRAEESINNLAASDYYFKMIKEIDNRGFCHHDFAHHNVLIDKNNEINIIDFDYCILDSHLHDLSSILIRRMKNGKWDIESARYIFDVYNQINKIESSDMPVMASFIQFPQEYWQLGIQYYWEKKDWGEEFFQNKLTKIIEDRDYREDFVNELMSFNYGGM